MPKTKTVSQGALTRQSPRAKKARLEAEEAADKEEQQVLDLTESSDDEIQEIKENENASPSIKSVGAPKLSYSRQDAYEAQLQAHRQQVRSSEAQRQQAYAAYMSQMQSQLLTNQMLMANSSPFQRLANQGSTYGLSPTQTRPVQNQNIAPRPAFGSSTPNSLKGGNGNGDMEFETGYKCMRCLKFFESRQELKNHIIKTHTDLLKFKCPKCGEAFSKQEKLERHERTHGRDKTYVCIQCDNCFYSLENLKRHEKIHEKKPEIKCGYCSRTYTEMDKLVMHERIHKKDELPFQCEECDEGFNARGNLKMHIRQVHTKKGKKK